jgi:enterochelin esterase family protein
VGGSSGGYGALQLLSLKDSPFTQAYAVAPDSFFDASLLPELRRMLPAFAEYGFELKRVKQALTSGELAQSKHFFHLVHGIAMAHCYAPQASVGANGIELPLDLRTGVVKKDLWKKWCEWDPIHFLPKRLAHLKGKRLVLEVGTYDEYSAQFGSRQIRDVLKGSGVKLSYREFVGNHFGLSERKLTFLESL